MWLKYLVDELKNQDGGLWYVKDDKILIQMIEDVHLD